MRVDKQRAQQARAALAERASARLEAALAARAPVEGVWQATFDGTAQGGLGRMAGGGVLFAPDGARHELVVPLLGHGCNNEAEYRALIAVLAALRKRGARSVHVWGDSDLVIRQLRGEQLGRAVRLAAWRTQAETLWRGFDATQATWVPRHANASADALAARALDPQALTAGVDCRRGLLDEVR